MSIELFLEEIRGAFSAKDPDRINALYCLPFTVIDENTTNTVNSTEELTERSEFISKLMTKANVDYIASELISQIAAGVCLTIVRYENIIHFKNGKSTLPTFATIVVRETDGRYGIAATINPIIKLAAMS